LQPSAEQAELNKKERAWKRKAQKRQAKAEAKADAKANAKARSNTNANAEREVDYSVLTVNDLKEANSRKPSKITTRTAKVESQKIVEKKATTEEKGHTHPNDPGVKTVNSAGASLLHKKFARQEHHSSLRPPVQRREPELLQADAESNK
jgi:hypothetical protein